MLFATAGWAAGRNWVHRWDGSTWASTDLEEDWRLVAISALSQSDVWAVGRVLVETEEPSPGDFARSRCQRGRRRFRHGSQAEHAIRLLDANRLLTTALGEHVVWIENAVSAADSEVAS